MKASHAILGALLASLLPSAWADEPSKAKSFSIAFDSDIQPVAYQELRYPSLAGSRNLSGSCDVRFTISKGGEADAIRIDSCSSEVFRSAAKAAVEKLAFSPRAQPSNNVKMQIRWTLGEPATLRTASLD